MRHRLLALALAASLPAVTGCKDALTAHADIAAEAGGQTLPAERLASLMAAAKGLQPTRESARDVANFWVDFTLFSQAVAAGEVFGDSATIAQAMWREVTELKGTHWYDSLMSRRSAVTPEQVEQLYAGDSLRLVQHVLIRADTSKAARATARRKAEEILTQARRGGTAEFGALAAANSADPGSARDSGFLPPSPRGAFVTAFDSATWALAPGTVSGLVETPYGYHVIRRPAAVDVRDRLQTFLMRQAADRLDDAYLDSLATGRNLKVNEDAPALMRAALDDPDAHHDSRKKIVTWQGGALTVGDYLRWVQALPPQFAMQARSAPDQSLSDFARAIGTNTVLLAQADSAGVEITGSEWQAIRLEYLARLDTLSRVMELGADLRDSTIPLADRQKLAALKVDQYLDRIVAGDARLRPLPSATFASILRERAEYEISPAGLQRSAELAAAKQAAARGDTTGGRQGGPAPAPAPAPGAPGGPTQAPGMEPAQGGPPVGGAPAPRP